jgi:hypothetical protein
MLESGLSGSARGVPSNGHPYRDPGPDPDAPTFPIDLRKLGGCRLRPTRSAGQPMTPRRYHRNIALGRTGLGNAAMQRGAQ